MKSAVSIVVAKYLHQNTKSIAGATVQIIATQVVSGQTSNAPSAQIIEQAPPTTPENCLPGKTGTAFFCKTADFPYPTRFVSDVGYHVAEDSVKIEMDLMPKNQL